eukprot:TRINITY_DN646_c0_g1_i1.p1 TRINITY_DN646_c0_g1~~TRINITY_DN646_c0_g1_i1.p1  ORF type:complete len:189 (+),score=44.57 TRINITY_DN646_c0_g1_i1:188-754(+)
MTERIDVRVAIFGTRGVGKDAIVYTYVNNAYGDLEYYPIIEDSYRKQISVNEIDYMLDILISPINNDNDNKELHVKISTGIFLVYSITSEESFNVIQEFIDEIIQIKGLEKEKIPIIIVGSKCDLEDKREVPTETGLEFAKKYRCPFYEISSKNKINLDNMFEDMIHEILSCGYYQESKPHEKHCTIS